MCQYLSMWRFSLRLHGGLPLALLGGSTAEHRQNRPKRGCFSQCFRLKWGWNPKHMKHMIYPLKMDLWGISWISCGPKSILIHHIHLPGRPSTATGPRHRGHPSPNCNAPAFFAGGCSARNSWDFTSPKNGWCDLCIFTWGKKPVSPMIDLPH